MPDFGISEGTETDKSEQMFLHDGVEQPEQPEWPELWNIAEVSGDPSVTVTSEKSDLIFEIIQIELVSYRMTLDPSTNAKVGSCWWNESGSSFAFLSIGFFCINFGVCTSREIS